MDEYPTPEQAKTELHADQERLARIDADEPADSRQRLGWLTARRFVAGNLMDSSSALVHAWDDAGDELAANAAEELNEHYQHLYKQADRDLETARQEHAAQEGIDL